MLATSGTEPWILYLHSGHVKLLETILQKPNRVSI